MTRPCQQSQREHLSLLAWLIWRKDTSGGTGSMYLEQDGQEETHSEGNLEGLFLYMFISPPTSHGGPDCRTHR